MQVDQYTLKQLLKEPETIEDLHIPQSIVIDLTLRLLFNEGNVSLSRFSEVLKLPSRILDNLMLWLQKEHLVEVSKANGGLGRLAYVYTLTDAGEQRARDAMDRSLYVGPVPVPIPFYNRAIDLQTRQRQRILPDQVVQSLNHLVLPSDFHRRIGPAVNAGASLFLYGPPGNGKTTIAQSIAQLVSGTDPIFIPYAITAGGQIIQIHDRLVHREIPLENHRTDSLGRIDHRWGLFQRPSVMVGGELKMDALDLRYEPVAKFYEAPLQLKANGGMFLIDDFGRQQVSPTDLLNRWIVPLESEMDFLRLHTGQTLVLPFKMLIVFSTNLDPNQLVDDAFLRRIHTKVLVGPPDEKLFYQIFVATCKTMNIPFDRNSFMHLVQNYYRQTGRTLQAVHPRDLIKSIIALCEYEGARPQLTVQLMDEACKSYFVD